MNRKATHLVEVWLCTICGDSGESGKYGSTLRRDNDGMRRWYCPTCVAEEAAASVDPFEADEAHDLTELLDLRRPPDDFDSETGW